MRNDTNRQLDEAGRMTPDPDNLTVIDCTGILLGNTDIVCEWTPTEISPGMAPLPIYPQWEDLPE